MNKKVKSKWVAALKSGKYKQVEGSLKKSEGFCCLGVLCDVYQKEKKKNFWRKSKYVPFPVFFGESAALPKKVMEWAGLKVNDPITQCKKTDSWGERKRRSLADLNDQYKLDFKQIADIIKRDL